MRKAARRPTPSLSRFFAGRAPTTRDALRPPKTPQRRTRRPPPPLVLPPPPTNRTPPPLLPCFVAVLHRSSSSSSSQKQPNHAPHSERDASILCRPAAEGALPPPQVFSSLRRRTEDAARAPLFWMRHPALCGGPESPASRVNEKISTHHAGRRGNLWRVAAGADAPRPFGGWRLGVGAVCLPRPSLLLLHACPRSIRAKHIHHVLIRTRACVVPLPVAAARRGRTIHRLFPVFCRCVTRTPKTDEPQDRGRQESLSSSSLDPHRF
jgi:hypothetical protein